MSFSNTKRFKAWQARKAERMGEIGFQLEDEVFGILDKMKQEGVVSGFCRFDHNSEESRSGKDFMVAKIVDRTEIHCFFGVTISPRSRNRAEICHRDVPQLCFPPGTKPETIKRRILDLPYS